MSMFSSEGNATLGEAVKWLEALPGEQVVELGFTHPHSYRGYYGDVAFEPCGRTTAGAMTTVARSALGAAYFGWKGGTYIMTLQTHCWLAIWGETVRVPVGVPTVANVRAGIFGSSQACLDCNGDSRLTVVDRAAETGEHVLPEASFDWRVGVWRVGVWRVGVWRVGVWRVGVWRVG
jgi:hypothetical protein